MIFNSNNKMRRVRPVIIIVKNNAPKPQLGGLLFQGAQQSRPGNKSSYNLHALIDPQGTPLAHPEVLLVSTYQPAPTPPPPLFLS